jgi:predicted TPR repeat methyltransferase
MLARLVDCTTGVDVAPSAIARARAAGAGPGRIEFRVENVMDHDFRRDRPWDLVVMNETIYYLGWLYSFFDIAWMANELFGATRPGGTFLMANTYGEISDHLLRPWIIRTYRDLFVNVGYTVKTLCGEKNNVALETLITVFVKAPSS